MKLRREYRVVSQRGFTLLELMLVMLILSLIVGAVFSQMSDAQQRLSTEETRLGDFQEARDFVDQFFRDINQAGTPNIRMFDPTQTFTPPLTTPYTYDSRFAVGLVKIDTSAIGFEGSVNGTGTVQSVIYQVNGSGTCSYCLQRSQVDKVTGSSQGQNWGTEINDVTNNTSGIPIFRYFGYDGTEITTTSSPYSLPADISTPTGAQAIANVKTVQINLTIRNPNIIDPKTGLPIETSFEGEISLNNCSMASTGQPMSCQ
jgi:prepilin-type N-terminal cleavage/methylation domain-containing protein